MILTILGFTVQFLFFFSLFDMFLNYKSYIPTVYNYFQYFSHTFHDGMRTPSYQGLKFLSLTDLCSLKETAILSDSDPDDLSSASSLNSLPGTYSGDKIKIRLPGLQKEIDVLDHNSKVRQYSAGDTQIRLRWAGDKQLRLYLAGHTQVWLYWAIARNLD